MSQKDDSNVSLRDFIAFRFDETDKHNELRFGTLNKRLDEILPDHEDRLRTLEKREPKRTIIEIVTGIIALIAAVFGINQRI